MEDSNLATERTQFANIDITQAPKPNQTGKAARLNAAENKPLGPWKSIPSAVSSLLKDDLTRPMKAKSVTLPVFAKKQRVLE